MNSNKLMGINSKVVIHQFDPIIYPRKLWVMVSTSVKQIKNKFNTGNYNISDFPSDSDAFVIPTTIKEGKQYKGVLVVFESKRGMTVMNIAHESVHVASQIFDDCNIVTGLDNCKDEHFAYLVGWVANCINQVKTNNFK